MNLNIRLPGAEHPLLAGALAQEATRTVSFKEGRIYSDDRPLCTVDELVKDARKIASGLLDLKELERLGADLSELWFAGGGRFMSQMANSDPLQVFREANQQGLEHVVGSALQQVSILGKQEEVSPEQKETLSGALKILGELHRFRSVVVHELQSGDSEALREKICRSGDAARLFVSGLAAKSPKDRKEDAGTACGVVHAALAIEKNDSPEISFFEKLAFLRARLTPEEQAALAEHGYREKRFAWLDADWKDQTWNAFASKAYDLATALNVDFFRKPREKGEYFWGMDAAGELPAGAAPIGRARLLSAEPG